jgi:hypothetical protein
MRKELAIVDFVTVAKSNGITNIWAALPRNHNLVWKNNVGQIRKVKDVLAFGFDELGNRVTLTTDLRVIQELS